MPLKVNTSGTIAVVFDFDDTLVPDSTSKLLREMAGLSDAEVANFWRSRAAGLVQKGYDQTHAYLKLLLAEARPEGLLAEVTNGDLRAFGKSLDNDFYPGIPEIFDDLRVKVSETVGLTIEFYIVTSGLEDVVRGSEIVRRYFRGVYGCLLAGDSDDGPLRYIRRAVTFSEKTRFLFEINKGIPYDKSVANPLLVNTAVSEEVRPVPFENMIYLGDGLTDIPCFSLVENLGGKAFGILQEEKIAGKSALSEMLGNRRARSLNAPKYGEHDDLGIILRTTVGGVCTDILYRRQQA
jgi:hypothetical protein